MECFLDIRNETKIRKAAFELLAIFIDILQDKSDLKLFNLLLSVIDFTPFINPGATDNNNPAANNMQVTFPLVCKINKPTHQPTNQPKNS